MNLYFIRHGDPNYDLDCLTEKGHEQGKLLGEKVKTIDLDKFFLSPQGRAQETASYCLKYFPEIEPVTYKWLRELEWGDLSGNAYATDGPWVKNDKIMKTDHAYPAGESWKDDERIKNDRLVGDVEYREKEFDRLMEELGYKREGQLYKVIKKNDESIAFVCHGGISSACMAHALNIPFWQFACHFPMAMTAISKLYIDGEVGEYVPARLDFYNYYEHLKEL